MILRRTTGEIQHRFFRELPGFLTHGDCLVVNKTRVLPARFVACRRTGGRIGGLFIGEESPGRWIVLLAGAGRLKKGETLALRSRQAEDSSQDSCDTGASAVSLPPRRRCHNGFGAGPDVIAEDVRGAKEMPKKNSRRYYGPGGLTSRWMMTLLRHRDRGMCEVQVEPPDPATDVLENIGAAPLPPYIHRSDDTPAELDRLDREHYQTVYAAEGGAIAAPTAGMHFTSELLDKIRTSGTAIADVLLHIGLGTFQPVEVEDLADHAMHREWYCLSHESAEVIRRTRAAGGRTVAVGTSSVRVLEACAERLVPRDEQPRAEEAGKCREKIHGTATGNEEKAAPPSPHFPIGNPRSATDGYRRSGGGAGRHTTTVGGPSGKTASAEMTGWTGLFIYPPHTFRATDVLLTNFHLPCSTLLALVCAFAGRETIMKAYQCAIDEGYRFYSYGDAMLIL